MNERRFQEPGYAPTADRFVRHPAERWGDRDLVVLGEHRLTYRAPWPESGKIDLQALRGMLTDPFARSVVGDGL